MKYYKQIISITLTILWMVVIFIMSSMPSNESNGKSKETISTVIEKTVETTNYSGITDKHPSEEKIKKITEFLNVPLRKCMHASEYFVLAILIFACCSSFTITNFKTYIVMVLGVFIYACTDEFHQLYVDGRTGQFIDVLIDTIGGLIAIIFIYMGNEYINKFKKALNK